MFGYLNVMIVTYNNRAENLINVLQEKRDYVGYIISHQVTKQLSSKTEAVIEKLKKRDDVIYSKINSKGVAKNRNNALKYARKGIALCSDDDVIYTKNAFEKILHSFSILPNADFITYKITTPEGKDYKKYPKSIKKHHLYTILSTGTVEMAFRIDKLKEKNISFDEDFGPGASKYPLGEDTIFIADAIKKGLRIYFYPIRILSHPYESSGLKIDYKTIFYRGAVFKRIYSQFCYVISALFSLKKIKSYKNRISLIRYLNLLLNGCKSYSK